MDVARLSRLAAAGYSRGCVPHQAPRAGGKATPVSAAEAWYREEPGTSTVRGAGPACPFRVATCLLPLCKPQAHPEKHMAWWRQGLCAAGPGDGRGLHDLRGVCAGRV